MLMYRWVDTGFFYRRGELNSLTVRAGKTKYIFTKITMECMTSLESDECPAARSLLQKIISIVFQNEVTEAVIRRFRFNSSTTSSQRRSTSTIVSSEPDIFMCFNLKMAFVSFKLCLYKNKIDFPNITVEQFFLINSLNICINFNTIYKRNVSIIISEKFPIFVILCEK